MPHDSATKTETGVYRGHLIDELTALANSKVKGPAATSERENFVADLIRYAPRSEARDARRLMRYARRYRNMLANWDGPGTNEKLADLQRTINKLCLDIDARPLYYAYLHVGVEDGIAMKIVKVPLV